MVVLTLHRDGGMWQGGVIHNYYSSVCTCIQEKVQRSRARQSVMVVTRKCYDLAYKPFPGFAKC